MKSLSLPRVETPRDFYLGALYALALTLLISLIFFKLLDGLGKIHSYALKKQSTVTVSLVNMPLTTTKQKPTPKPVPKQKQEAAAKPTETSAPVEDISSLFSEVKTQKIVHKKRPVKQQKLDSKRIAALQKRIKTTHKRKASETSKTVKNLSLVRPMQHAGGMAASGGEEVNAYFAKIQATIYEQFFPPVNSQGSVAQVRIWLSTSGRLTRFKILRRSGEPLFDQEVERLGKRLAGIMFERNPQGKEAVLDVSLVSKE